MAEEQLHIELTRPLLDRPGGEGVPEAVAWTLANPVVLPSLRSICFTPFGRSATV